MAYVYFNANPFCKEVNDCIIRAISLAAFLTWDEVFLGLSDMAFSEKDIMISNRVWPLYLKQLGFVRRMIPNTCPLCYSIKDFCLDNPTGIYILGTGKHVVTVIDGDYYDTWDSGNEVPLYFWQKGV